MINISLKPNYKIGSIFKIFLLSSFLLILNSCGEKKTEEEHEEEKSETEVALTTAQFETVGIEMGSIEMKNLNTIIKANGYTTVPPQNRADVSTLIGGVVKDIFVLEGTYVAKGKTLATLQNLQVAEMQEDYNAAVANIEYLQLEYNRQKTLSEEDVNPRKVFQEVKAKLATERARAQAAKNKLQALNVSLSGNSSIIPIIAPISGYVGKIGITKGTFADTGISLFEVIDNTQMHLDLNVFENSLESSNENQDLNQKEVEGYPSLVKKNLFKEKQHVPVVNTVNMMSSEEAQTIIALLLATKKV